MAATYSAYVDWDGDGDFSDTGEDVSSRTLARTDVVIRYGRDQARALSPTAVGEARLELDNTSRDYSPENASSPLAGDVLPGRPVLIEATLSAVDYTLFRGHLDDFNILPDRSARSVDVTCLDPLAKLRGVRVTTDLHQGLQTGQAIGLLLDAADWPADLRDLDPGATTIGWWWMDDADAFDALMQLVDSEGPPALVTADGDGRVVFRDRHHRLTRAASTTSQATFSDEAEPAFSPPLVYDHGWRDIVNAVSFSVPVRSPAGILDAVWSAQGQHSILDGQTVPISARATDPFIGAVTPEADVDYQLLSGTVTMTLSRTSGQALTVFVTATGGPAVIADLQVRAYPLETAATVLVSAEDTTSIARYGRRSLPSGRDPVWAGIHDAGAIADLILAQRAERLPTVTITLKGSSDTRLTQQLTRDLSDRVRIVDDETGLDADCYIEQITHTLTDAGKLHITSFGCEKAAEPVTGVLILDDAALGLLNTATLGGIGQSDPDTVFLLDDASQGQLDTGLLAY